MHVLNTVKIRNSNKYVNRNKQVHLRKMSISQGNIQNLIISLPRS